MVLLSQELSLLRIFVAEINNIEGSSALVSVSNLVLVPHLLNFLALALLFVFHVLPPSEVTLVLLHSFGVHDLLLALRLDISSDFVVGGEVSVESVIFRQKV